VILNDIDRVAFACADWWADRLECADKRDAFRASLQRRIIDECHPEYGMRLEVDYDPSGPLLRALHDIGVECRGFMFSADGLFPTKTRMYISKERVEVVEGYAAPRVCLLGAPREVTP
jgi:hypothetical protein